MKQKQVMKVLCLLLFSFLSACGGGGGVSSEDQPNDPVAYSISGRVNGAISQSVPIAFSGAVSANVLTDQDGNYAVSGLPNGSYTITPSKAGYTFTPSRSIVINAADSTGNDFTAEAVLYQVVGTVSGAVAGDVEIAVNGTTERGSAFSASIVTSGASFSVPNVPNGHYTVIPAKPGYAFSPASLAVTINASDVTGIGFAAVIDASANFNLSGTVRGDILAGVTISVSGPASASTATGADGSYIVPHLPNGTYTVSASKPGYAFSAELTVNIANEDANGNDFTATALLYTISGRVSGDVAAGVTITTSGTTEGGAAFGPVEVTTIGGGTYSVPDIPNGTYTVAAAKPGYLFNPLSHAVTIAAGDSSNRDFTALLNPLTAFRANGGNGTNGSGGAGGEFYVESVGSIKVLKSGTVDASFTAPTITPEFGTNPYVVSTDTTVLLDSDPNDGESHLYAKTGDPSLYLGNGDGDAENDMAITGLAINAGVTLVMVVQWEGYGTLHLENDLVVHGTIAADLSTGMGLYIEANFIDVESTGKITASATSSDSSGGEIFLGYGEDMTHTIINRGTIEARGTGTESGGYIYLQPGELFANFGTIDASGGTDGGTGGRLEAYIDYGDFYSSGTVRLNGGNGQPGGEANIVTISSDNSMGRTGDIFISGSWEAKGGDSTGGFGGPGGYLSFQTLGMGTVTVNASMSVKGGNGTGGGFDEAFGGEINFVSSLEGGTDNPAPGKISIAGIYDLRGGDDEQTGGNGGYFYVASRGVNSSNMGSDVELLGFPVINLNGGEGGENGGSASGSAFGLYTYSYSEWVPSKSITNEADVQAKGGKATGEGASGGNGGYAEMVLGAPNDAESVLNNSGSINVSGGEGETGGTGGEVVMQAQHVVNSGDVTANGGDGFTQGGSGGNIALTSDVGIEPTTNTGLLSVDGGAPDGAPGTINIDGGGIM